MLNKPRYLWRRETKAAEEGPLSTMKYVDTLASYLPSLIVEHLLDSETDHAPPHRQRYQRRMVVGLRVKCGACVTLRHRVPGLVVAVAGCTLCVCLLMCRALPSCQNPWRSSTAKLGQNT